MKLQTILSLLAIAITSLLLSHCKAHDPLSEAPLTDPPGPDWMAPMPA